MYSFAELYDLQNLTFNLSCRWALSFKWKSAMKGELKNSKTISIGMDGIDSHGKNTELARKKVRDLTQSSRQTPLNDGQCKSYLHRDATKNVRLHNDYGPI